MSKTPSQRVGLDQQPDPLEALPGGGLERLIQSGRQAANAAARSSAPGTAGAARPVELWNPPYCGDIGLRIRRDGVWLYRDSPIHRQGLVSLFASILRKDDDGRTYLVTPVEKVDCHVEDAPFLAVEMTVDGEGQNQTLAFRTNLDDVVTVDGDHPLRFGIDPANGGVKPYVRVRGRLDALVTRAVAVDLIALALASAEDTPGVWSRGQWIALPVV